MRPKQMVRTADGGSTCLLIGKICPSILILIGAFEVKNRSDALRSTMSLNSGLVLSAGCPSEPVISSGSAAMLVRLIGLALTFFFVGDRETAVGFDRLVVPLALELDAQPQLVLRVGIAQRVFVRDVD